MTVRICPNPDGTYACHVFDEALDDYRVASPQEVCRLLQVEGTYVEVAMTDPICPWSHYESHDGCMTRI